ncbi:MAG: MFS transporter [Candidatus Bipolaricaulota bacterium]|nr:MFS transporter [Candidatus Bipolaricaulota bacterium]MDW8030560.1 MFS transporter [Candidatus Bipolaricaulota bacterium]
MKLTAQISRTVFLLGIVSLLNDLAGELIMAVLPIFLIGLGSAGWVVGLIGGLEDATKSLLSLVFGGLADRLGRKKPLVFLGYLIPSVFRIALPFSTHWAMALAFRVLDRMGKGMRTAPRDALIADSVTEATRGANFGFHRAMDTGGALLGSALAFVFFWWLNLPVPGIILVGGLISVASLIPLGFVSESVSAAQRSKLFEGLRELPKAFYLNLLGMSIFALANFSYMFFLLKVNAAYTDKLAVGLPIGMYVLYNFTYTLCALPAGVLSDKIGRRAVLLMGYLIFGMTSLGFAFARSLVLFVPLFAFYGIAYAFIESNQRAFAADLAPLERRGTALGLFHMCIGFGSLLGSCIAGVLWEISHALTFFYGAALAAVSLAFLAARWE